MGTKRLGKGRVKKLTSIYKSTLLTVKTATGIKRFKDEKEWFDILRPLMDTIMLCQPDHAVEQIGAGSTDTTEDFEVTDADAGSASSGSGDLAIDHAIMDDLPSSSSSSKKDLFVPVKARPCCKSSVFKKIATTNLQVTVGI